MAEARYFHATLYRFAPAAFQEVILRFNDLMQDVSARCWYDTTQDTFCVTAPYSIGPLANSNLNKALGGYIQEEITSAEREDRPAAIKLLGDEIFDESVMFDELCSGQQGTSEDENITEASPAQPVTLHYINLEDAASSRIKLFKICELHGGLVDRVLSRNDSTAKKIMQQSMSARIVSWDQRKELHVFNGRYGEPTGISLSPDATILEASKFLPIDDLRTRNGHKTDKGVVSAQSWKFKNEDNIDIHRFLQGMGEIELEDPETTPDRPEDAAGFLAHCNLPQLPQGRLRVPKVIASDESNSDSDNEDDCHSLSNAMNHSQIVQPPQLDVSITSDISFSAVPTIQVNTGAHANDLRPPTLRSPFQLLQHENKPPQTGAASNYRLGTSPPQTSKASQAPTLNSVTAGPPQTGSIPEYGGSYANVDKIGLGGNAPNQATWEHENPSPKKKTTTKSGITRRIAATSSDSQISIPVPHTGQDVRTYGPSVQSSTASASTSSLPSPSTVSNNAVPKASRNWVNNVVRPTSTGPKLIDDTVGSISVISKGKEADHFADLVTAMRSKATVPVNAGSGGRPSQSTYRRSNDIVERLQVTPDDPMDRKYTMNQKAKKPKKKKAQNKPNASKAALPTPDPLPAPQIPPTRNEIKAQKNSNLQAPTKLLNLNDLRDRYISLPSPARSPSQSRSPSPEPREASTKESEKGMVAIEQLLHDVSATSILEDAKLHVDFGMILSSQQGSKDPLPKDAVTKDTLQAKFQSGIGSYDATFLTRLSTSIHDALFLLSDSFVPGSPAIAALQYEIIMKNPDGRLSTIRVDHADRSNLQLVADSGILGTLYVHYPIRIWDAKVTIERAVFDAPTQAAIEFVSSIQTTDEPPSFIAKIPSAAFSIEKVYAKRIFSKTVQLGLELVATEVQELSLESIDDPKYNVKVAALPTEQMVNEQRLWWECGLRSELVDPEGAKELQCMIDKMITKMDGVGYGNKGPWTKAEVNEGQTAAEQWFW